MRERGSGSLFREKYRDKKTGELKACRTWTMKLWVGGKRLKRSAGTASRAVANKKLEQWKAAVRQGVYVPDADQTRFDDLAALLLDEYRANGRKSLVNKRLEQWKAALRQGVCGVPDDRFKGCPPTHSFIVHVPQTLSWPVFLSRYFSLNREPEPRSLISGLALAWVRSSGNASMPPRRGLGRRSVRRAHGPVPAARCLTTAAVSF